MNLKQLEYFTAAAEYKNISVAAKKLHMAQPPLSRQIQLLEEELETQLLLRNNKGIELTEAGEILYGKVKELFLNIDEIRAVLKELEEGLQGTIKIAACYSTISIITEKMHQFSKIHPKVHFSFVHGTIEELMDSLHNGQTDLLFLRNCIRENKDFSYQLLPEDPLQFVIHRDMDPNPEQSTVTVDYLKGIPLCILDEGKFPGYSNFLISECEAHSFRPNILCDCYDTSVAMALALTRVAASFQPRSIIETYHHPDLMVKHIEGLETKSYPVVIWNDGHYQSRCTKNFLEFFIGKREQRLSYSEMKQKIHDGG